MFAERSTEPAAKTAEQEFDAAFAVHASAVRRYLRAVGVGESDLDDTTQEVFLLLHNKRIDLATAERIDPWLREVCRRVGAGYRRRAHRRHEIVQAQPPDHPNAVGSAELSLEQQENEYRLYSALRSLDEESRDLVALHELGALPLLDLAKLVEADRKTVRKRLAVALRKLTKLFASRGPGIDSEHLPGIEVAKPYPRLATNDGVEFRPLAKEAAVRIGLVGAVLIAVWPGPPTLEALELLAGELERVGREHGAFVYLAVVESSTRPPNRLARQKIVEMLRACAPNRMAHLTVLEGGGAWIARPIMTGLALLAQQHGSVQFFNGAHAAAEWLAAHPAQIARADAQQILAAIQQLRLP